MSYTAILGQRTGTVGGLYRRHAIALRWKFGYLTLMIITVILASLLTVIYFFQVQRMTFAGYEISDMEQEIRELRDMNRKLQYEVSQQKSLSIIEVQATEKLQMIPAYDIKYWWGENGELAKRQ